MKRTIMAVLAVLFFAQTVRADEYNGHVDEWAIPADIHTQADIQRYEGYRQGLIVFSVGAALGALICAKQAAGLRSKANHVDIRGPITGYPQPGGGILYRYPIEEGMVEGQNRFYSKAAMYKKGSIIGGLGALMALGISFSLRF